MSRGEMLGRSAALAVVLGVVAALLAAPTAAYAGENGTAARPALVWGPCPKGTATGRHADRLECATLRVPLDHRTASGPTIEVMISRLPSAHPDRRRGVLLVNPGGPGNSGLGMPAELADLGASKQLLARYDVIGFDPRGVGHSAPISCGFTADQPYRRSNPPYARSGRDVAAHAKVVRQAARRCARHDPDHRLRFFTTANTARDMDRIRRALGASRISYYGASYGTALGATYATLFPERTDRVVLDSNLGASTQSPDSFRRMGLGAEDRFPDLAAYVADRDDAYRLGATPQAVRRGYFRLAEKLDAEPVAGIDGRVFREAIYLALYRDSYFPRLAKLWSALERGDPELVRRVTGGQPPLPPQTDNNLSAGMTVTCNDRTWPRSVETYRRHVEVDRRRYPVFGPAMSNVTACAFWPIERIEPPVELTSRGPSNILLLQNLRDPSTPYVGGLMMRAKLGRRARLVSIDQGGHGAFVYNRNRCGLEITMTFLVDGRRPATDRSCPS